MKNIYWDIKGESMARGYSTRRQAERGSTGDHTFAVGRKPGGTGFGVIVWDRQTADFTATYPLDGDNGQIWPTMDAAMKACRDVARSYRTRPAMMEALAALVGVDRS